MSIDELRTEKDRIWAELKELEGPYKAKQQEFCNIMHALENAKLREQIRAEVLAEGKGE